MNLSSFIKRSDSAIAPYTHDAVITATPDYVARPKTVQDVQDVIQHCHHHMIPLTVCGSRTSMTGSSVTDDGILMTLEGLSGVINIDTESRTVTVRPGTILGDMQQQVESKGLYYPPSPTSRNECTVGATLATNATGDSTFKYGTTRRYVREITVLTADGTQHVIVRKGPPPNELKNSAGYFINGEEIDLFIGSEGTLGVIVEAKLALIERPDAVMTFMIPFPTNNDALHFISNYKDFSDLTPRTMEFIDKATAKIMSQSNGFPKLPENARAFVICQQEFTKGSEEDCLDSWFSALGTTLTRCKAPQLTNFITVAQSDKDQSRIAAWRHHIPSHVSEIHRTLQTQGGGKIGTDWWVPLPRMIEMMNFAYTESDKLNIPYIAFGHLGNGHPHFNYFARNAAEKSRAYSLVLDCCRMAVSLGGGVAGEHGIGKIKHDLLKIQHSPEVIQKMIALKQKWDPLWILGRGNIFTKPNT
ncbi:MAG: hypothetical protein COV45_04170 [Deltaproteobacteria bacterium CG11_big_fil_rev_8_21_14_0_20_47_16]|nr:MAG: hypothetical protein COV45_04170 [Deltaproteobacteria bacterium CG11_big_fil_rev_8_21_14_0_20_47_16]